MYELWLVMNIVWEIALGIWPWLALAAAVWLALLARAWPRPAAAWRRALAPALAIAAVAAVAGFVLVPGATRSSLQELAYWVDWANLIAIAGGIGAAALAFAWPALVRRVAEG